MQRNGNDRGQTGALTRSKDEVSSDRRLYFILVFKNKILTDVKF